MPRPLDLSGLPRAARRRPWAALLASAAAHLLLFAFGWVGARAPDPPRRAPHLVLLTPPGGEPEVVEMRYQGGRGAVAQGGRPEAPGVPPAPVTPPRRMATAPQRLPLREGEVIELPADTGSRAAEGERPPLIGRIGPGLAEGRLWVRPLPLPPRELAKRLEKSHAELVDSAVTAIVQGYLDSIAMDPTARGVGLPSWTTEVAGRRFGLDSQNIYLGGLKIPAAVLALLPLPQGNVDQNRAYSHLMELRSDLHRAARRAENLAEFKDMIREMRLRKEREREFEENQRTAPPPTPEEIPVP